MVARRDGEVVDVGADRLAVSVLQTPPAQERTPASEPGFSL
jgi:hypothetical protein